MAWWAGSSAVWSRKDKGGASAPPDPLPNPIEALVKQAKEMGFLVIVTGETTYEIEKHRSYGNWTLRYAKKSVLGGVPKLLGREWHLIANGGKSTDDRALYALIAAIVSEDSFVEDTEHRRRGGRKLHTMVCGTGVYTLPNSEFILNEE